jgi:flagellin
MNINSLASSTTSLRKSAEESESVLKKMATAKRINTAADDAAGLQIANRLTQQSNGASQGIRNVYDGISLANVADQTLAGVTDNLTELNRLTVQAGNGMLTADDRQALQDQVSQLTNGIKQQLSDSNFGGMKLFDSAQKLSFDTGNGLVSVQSNDLNTELTNSGVLNIDVTDPSSLQTAQDSLKSFTEQVSAGRAEFGASINRLDSAARGLMRMDENTQAARSRIEDLDYAKVVSEQVASQIREKASIAMISQGRVSAEQAANLLS